MVSRHFRLRVAVRVTLLGLTALLLAFLIVRRFLPATTTLVALLLALQAWLLVRFVERTHRDLARLLESIRFSDFTIGFDGEIAGAGVDELRGAMSEVASRFREISREREEQARYLDSVVQHVGIGLVAWREDGAVELVNTAARRLLDVARLDAVDDLARIAPPLGERLTRMEPGERDLVTATIGGRVLQLSVYLTRIRMRERTVTLASFQNITSELDEREMEAWRNLVRVFTHEIKNSITPIESLAATLEGFMGGGEGAVTRALGDDAEDARAALRTIRNRSRGLLQFVDAYRNLTHVPRPEIETTAVAGIVARVEALVIGQATAPVDYRRSIKPEALELEADPKLVEQVLINLVLNAVQAIGGRGDGRVEIAAAKNERGRVYIQVTDNGPGIQPDLAERIFVPFFSTKKEGSGIGLSLSRQIMRQHRGDLTVESIPGERTTFTMSF